MADVASAELDAAQNAIITEGTTYYLSLHTGDPGGTGANEGSDGRQAIIFGSSSAGVQTSTDSQTWASPGTGATYTNFGIWIESTDGDYLRGGSFTTSFTTAGTSFTINTGAVTLNAS